MLDQLAAALGVKKGIVVAALIGAFLAALIKSRLQDTEKAARSWFELFVTVVVGFFASVYGTEPLVAWLEWRSQYEHGLAFFVGLFSMAIVDKALALLKAIDWELLKGVFRK